MLNFTEMPPPIEYYHLMLCEDSRLYLKKWLRIIPENITCVNKIIMEKTAFKERPYFVESYCR